MKTLRNSLILALFVVIALGESVLAQAKKKVRWTPQARGYAIGAGTGAAAGAIIHKRNRVLGGVVGAAVGAATGYAVGKAIDNKNQRNARIEAARRAAEQQSEQQEVAAAESAPTVIRRRASVPSVTRRSPSVARPARLATRSTAVAATYVSPEKANPVPYLIDGIYLPNPSFGDDSAPYGTSEERRKSW